MVRGTGPYSPESLEQRYRGGSTRDLYVWLFEDRGCEYFVAIEHCTLADVSIAPQEQNHVSTEDLRRPLISYHSGSLA